MRTTALRDVRTEVILNWRIRWPVVSVPVNSFSKEVETMQLMPHGNTEPN